MLVVDELAHVRRVRIHSVGASPIDVEVTGPLAVPVPSIVEELDAPSGRRIHHWVVHPDGRVEVRAIKRGYTEAPARSQWPKWTEAWAVSLGSDRRWTAGLARTGPITRCVIISGWLYQEMAGEWPPLVPSPSAVVVERDQGPWNTSPQVELHLTCPHLPTLATPGHDVRVRHHARGRWNRAVDDGIAALAALGVDAWTAIGEWDRLLMYDMEDEPAAGPV